MEITHLVTLWLQRLDHWNGYLEPIRRQLADGLGDLHQGFGSAVLAIKCRGAFTDTNVDNHIVRQTGEQVRQLDVKTSAYLPETSRRYSLFAILVPLNRCDRDAQICRHVFTGYWLGFTRETHRHAERLVDMTSLALLPLIFGIFKLAGHARRPFAKTAAAGASPPKTINQKNRSPTRP